LKVYRGSIGEVNLIPEYCTANALSSDHVHDHRIITCSNESENNSTFTLSG